ncbi:hypothetical protein F5051DRAFT_403649 [Lentinula edodes]|nr:hypothetical protein F5051DRAFT_403649 [Lentinula edodes]
MIRHPKPVSFARFPHFCYFSCFVVTSLYARSSFVRPSFFRSVFPTCIDEHSRCPAGRLCFRLTAVSLLLLLLLLQIVSREPR